MLRPLATQHPGEGKTCPPKGPSPHLAVAAALTPLDAPSFPFPVLCSFTHSPAPPQPTATCHFIRNPNRNSHP